MALTLNPNPDPNPDPNSGTPGVWLFALGLFGAGVSSTLTVGLGTALAIEDILGLHAAAPAALAAHDAASDACHRSSSSSAVEIRPATQPDDSGGGGGGGGGGGVLSRGRRRRRLRAWLVESTRWCRHGKACFYVPFFAMGALPSLLRMNTISVIQLAQVINGCLLPNIAALLMIAVNDHALMRGKPQSSQLNVLMAPCAGMALFLASVVLLDQSVGRLAAGWSGGRSLQLAAPITLGGLVALLCAVRRARRQHTGPASTGAASSSTSRAMGGAAAGAVGGAARGADASASVPRLRAPATCAVRDDAPRGERGLERGAPGLAAEVEFEVTIHAPTT